MPVLTLETPRLLLREWRETDREPFATMNADPEVMRHFPAPLTREASDALVDRIVAGFAARGFGLWAVEVRGSGEFIGFTGLAAMPDGMPGEGGTEIGWRLARSAWHHGFATEAATEVRDAAFGTLGLPELWSLTAETNIASQAVMARIGMCLHSKALHPRLPEDSPLQPHVVYHLPSPWPRTVEP